MRELEALLALLFCDIGALASGGMLRDSAETNLGELDGAALSDAIVDRFPDCNSTALRVIVEDIVAQTEGDPLDVLRFALATAPTQPGGGPWRRFPLLMFELVAVASPPAVPFPVAESHVHTGAILPPHMLVRGIGQRAARLSKDELGGSQQLTATGLTVVPAVLMAGVRFALRTLWHCHARFDPLDAAEREASGLDAVWMEHVLTGTFWTNVAALDVEVDRASFASLAREMPNLGRCPRLDDLVWSAAVAERIDHRCWRLLTTGLIRACAFLIQQVSSRPGEGLTRFVDRFDAMGLYRDAALDDAKKESIVWALDLMVRDVELVGAEFRKTVVAGDSKAFSKAVTRGLSVHSDGFARFQRGLDGTPRALSMPVGWRRTAESAPEPFALRELRAVTDGVIAIDRVLRSIEGSADTIFST